MFNNSIKIPRIFWRERLILVSAGVTLTINILLWIVTFGKFGLGNELLPLHFSVVYGIDFVGSSRQIYELPAAALVILLVNFSLGILLYGFEKLLSYFLFFAAAIAQAFFLIALLALVILNA